MEKRVLHNDHLDLALEALATKIARVLSIQTRHIDEVEMRILLQLLAKLGDDSIFYFFLHCFLLLALLCLLRVDSDTRAHGGRHKDTLDVSALCSSRLQLDNR